MERKIQFKTRLNPPKIEPQAHFSEFQDNYEMTLDSKGREKLIKKGKTNVYEKIQMYKDDCDIYKIIQRAALGDTALLEKRVGQYIDTTGLPTTLQESFEFMTKAKSDFEKLPAEIREKFDNNLYSFAQATSADLEKVINELKGIHTPKEQTENKTTTEVTNEQEHGK